MVKEDVVGEVVVENECCKLTNEKIFVECRLSDVVVICGQVNGTAGDIIKNLHQEASKIIVVEDGKFYINTLVPVFIFSDKQILF